MRMNGFIVMRNEVIISLTVMLLLMASTLKMTSGSLQKLGALSIVTVLLIGVLLLAGYLTKVRTFPVSIKHLFVPALALLGIYALGLIQGGINLRALISIAQLFLVLAFFFSMVIVKWSGYSTKVFAAGASVFIISNFSLWIYAGIPDFFSSYMAHKNSLGGILFGFFFFLFAALLQSQRIARLFWCATIAVGLLLIYSTNSRASWLACLVVVVTFLLWKVIIKTRARFNFYFVGVVCLLFIVTLVYPYLPQIEGFGRYRELVQLYTGASLFSGRDRLWPALIELISMRPFLGHGTGVLPSDFISTTLSSHSIYLQIALQVGLVGLLVFMFFLHQLWSIFWEGRDDPIVRLSGAYLIGIMVHQLFEISLTQNNLSLGILQWLILAIGVGRAMGGHCNGAPFNGDETANDVSEVSKDKLKKIMKNTV